MRPTSKIMEGQSQATNREATKALRTTIAEEKAKTAVLRTTVRDARAAKAEASKAFLAAERSLSKQKTLVQKLEARLPKRVAAS